MQIWKITILTYPSKTMELCAEMDQLAVTRPKKTSPTSEIEQPAQNLIDNKQNGQANETAEQNLKVFHFLFFIEHDKTNNTEHNSHFKPLELDLSSEISFEEDTNKLIAKDLDQKQDDAGRNSIKVNIKEINSPVKTQRSDSYSDDAYSASLTEEEIQEEDDIPNEKFEHLSPKPNKADQSFKKTTESSNDRQESHISEEEAEVLTSDKTCINIQKEKEIRLETSIILVAAQNSEKRDSTEVVNSRVTPTELLSRHDVAIQATQNEIGVQADICEPQFSTQLSPTKLPTFTTFSISTLRPELKSQQRGIKHENNQTSKFVFELKNIVQSFKDSQEEFLKKSRNLNAKLDLTAKPGNCMQYSHLDEIQE
ncbi:viral A-type inclusion protein, partial [Reticulomyxa filosa]